MHAAAFGKTIVGSMIDYGEAMRRSREREFREVPLRNLLPTRRELDSQYQNTVIPAQEGIQKSCCLLQDWILAFAGMTDNRRIFSTIATEGGILRLRLAATNFSAIA